MHIRVAIGSQEDQSIGLRFEYAGDLDVMVLIMTGIISYLCSPSFPGSGLLAAGASWLEPSGNNGAYRAILDEIGTFTCLVHSLMVVHECDGITRSFLNYSIVQNDTQIVAGTSLTSLVEIVM